MDALKVHLLLNYYPAIGVVLGTLILAAGFLFRNARTKRSALKLITVMAVLTLAVAFSGEFASWSAEASAGPGRLEALERHKLTATVALVSTIAAGAAALAGVIRGRADAERPSGTYVLALVLAIVASALLITTIFKGRQVKWAAIAVPAGIGTTETENKLWHA